MIEKGIDKASKLASSISSIGKLLIGLVVFIFAVGTAWYQIETNASDNVRQDEQFKALMESQESKFSRIVANMTKEFDLWGQRSDKRYIRAMNEAKELHKHDDEQEKDIMTLVKEIWYIKGKLDERDKH